MWAFSYPHGSEQSSHFNPSLSCFQTGKDSGWATTTTGVGVGYSMNEPVLAREEVALDTSRDSSHKSKASNGGIQSVRNLPYSPQQGHRSSEVQSELRPNTTPRLYFPSLQDPSRSSMSSSTSSNSSITNFKNTIVPALLSNTGSTSNISRVSETPLVSRDSQFSKDETQNGFRMPSPRNGADIYNLRPQRFVNGIEVIHRDDGSKLVDPNGNPINEECRPVHNGHGYYVGYATGNYRVDRNGVRFL